MSDKTPSYAKIITVSIVVSALVSTSFGFVAGFVASQTAWSENLMAILPSTVRQFVPTPKPESGEQKYSLPEIRDQIKPPTAEDKIVKVVEQASPAVVSIVISKDMPIYEQYVDPNQNNDFFSQFFQDFPGFNTPQYRQKGTEKQEIGAGTGFIVSVDGFIVTNKHVVSDTAAEYMVIMSDETKYVAKVIGRDPSNDLAILKIGV